MEPYVSGTLAGTGSFRCDACGYVLTLAAADRLSDCPGCGGDAFSRASLFSAPTAEAAPAFTDADREDWLNEARTHIDEAGEYLAYEDGDRTVVVALTRGWTRIGRSLAANVPFHDPPVSRRPALTVRPPAPLRCPAT